MERLLRQTGFDSSDLNYYNSELKQLSSILKLDDSAVSSAAEKLPFNFDLSYESIRMLLNELIKTVLDDLKTASDKSRKLYQAAVPMPNAVAAVVNELNDEIKVTSSEYLIIYLSGILFNVYPRICFNGNVNTCQRCGLNISRENLYLNLSYPKPDAVMSCFAYCDELYKTGETLKSFYGIPHIHVSDIKGILFDEQKEYLSGGLKDVLIELSRHDEADIHESLKKFNDKSLEINLLLNRVNEITAKQKSIFASFNEISLINLFNLIYVPGHYEKGKKILNLFLKEIKQRIRDKNYKVENPLRIGCMHLPFINPEIDRIFLKNNASVIVSSLYYVEEQKHDFLNEYERCLGAFYSKTKMKTLKERAEYIDLIIDHYSLDVFLFGQFENDRALGSDQLLIMKLMKNKDKIYYLPMKNWQPPDESAYTRIESLVEVLNERIKV